MKTCLVTLGSMAGLLLLQLAVAGDNEPKVEKKVPVKVKVEKIGVGKVIIIRPDGKTEVKEFNTQLPKEVLDKLPKEIRDRIQQGLEKCAKCVSCGPAGSGKMRIVIEKDGKRQELELDLGTSGEDLRKQGIQPPPEVQKVIKILAQAKKADESLARLKKVQIPPTGVQAKAPVDINAKLDKILERLDRLEKDIKALKTKKN